MKIEQHLVVNQYCTGLCVHLAPLNQYRSVPVSVSTSPPTNQHRTGLCFRGYAAVCHGLILPMPFVSANVRTLSLRTHQCLLAEEWSDHPHSSREVASFASPDAALEFHHGELHALVLPLLDKQ